MKTYVREAGGARAPGGFTLLEMLIAVVILGILAMVVIPQVTTSSNDAMVSAVKDDLSTMRNALETYSGQHGNVYPGGVKTDGTGTGPSGPSDCATWLVTQLTTYSQSNGKANKDSSTLTAPLYGPYLKGAALPTNPFNSLNTATCDITTTDVTVRTADSSYGWKFYLLTGVLIADDGGTSGGIAHVTY